MYETIALPYGVQETFLALVLGGSAEQWVGVDRLTTPKPFRVLNN
jgi:hypothetical protein